MTADLHIHSYYSDGLLSPEEIALTAKRNGVELISLTDHDTMEGAKKTEEACLKQGIKFVHGVEISSYIKDIKIHMTCYRPDENNPQFKAFLKRLYENSFERTDDILKKLKAVGFNISREEVDAERYSKSAPIHSMHIARAAAKKGYADCAVDFYFKYIGYGTAGYSNLLRPEPDEVASIVSGAGGLACIAHPGRIYMEKEELISLISRLKGCGLAGIEGVYSSHTDIETAYYIELAKREGLFLTGGSDTHYSDGSRRIGTPRFIPDPQLLKRLGIEE